MDPGLARWANRDDNREGDSKASDPHSQRNGQNWHSYKHELDCWD